MTAANLPRSHKPDLLSRIGGAAQGGSAKTPQERKSLNREHEEKQKEKDSPLGADVNSPETTNVANDERAGQERRGPDRNASGQQP